MLHPALFSQCDRKHQNLCNGHVASIGQRKRPNYDRSIFPRHRAYRLVQSKIEKYVSSQPLIPSLASCKISSARGALRLIESSKTTSFSIPSRPINHERYACLSHSRNQHRSLCRTRGHPHLQAADAGGAAVKHHAYLEKRFPWRSLDLRPRTRKSTCGWRLLFTIDTTPTGAHRTLIGGFVGSS